MAHSIELDVAMFGNETVADAINSLTDGLDVQHEVIAQQGPAGWPVIKFSSTSENELTKLRARYNGA